MADFALGVTLAALEAIGLWDDITDDTSTDEVCHCFLKLRTAGAAQMVRRSVARDCCACLIPQSPNPPIPESPFVPLMVQPVPTPIPQSQSPRVPKNLLGLSRPRNRLGRRHGVCDVGLWR